MRKRIVRDNRVNVANVGTKARKKNERQKFLYGQAVNGIMLELSIGWEEAKIELSKRMAAVNIGREFKTI